MKILSGCFLSKLAQLLAEGSGGDLSHSQLAESIVTLLAAPESFVELNAGDFTRDSLNVNAFPFQRISVMDKRTRATMNTLLPWSSYNVVNAQPLGGAYLPDKRFKPHAIPDRSCEVVRNLLTPESTVLEVGCFEGHYTTTLATYCRQVYGFDSRIENVLKTLVRTWALGMDRKIIVDLLDIEKDDIFAYYRSRGVEHFDHVYHRGVLYHLSDPVSHLANLAPLAKSSLYLHTHYANDSQPTQLLSTSLGDFQVFNYKEGKRAFAPFAGMEPKAAWLRRDDLIGLLRRLGFDSIEVIADVAERNGNRIELIAKRKV